MSKYCCHCLSEIQDGDSVCSLCNLEQIDEIPVHHITVGTVLRERYAVGKAIGEGGFGITYIGKDLLLNIKVAIKEFFPNGYVNRNNTVSMVVYGSTSEERRSVFDKGKDRFLSEARILAMFSKEPGIVDVKDFFETNNTVYIVMEYLEGQTLKQLLARNGKYDPEVIWTMFTPVMRSLSEIHKRDLIHRDISPDNIMCVDNTLKLLDFGAARNISAAANKSLSVMLKPGYAPEEQYRSKGKQGAWTDIYALSATIYKCITGITPDDSTERIIDDTLKTPSALGISISTNFENALMKGLAVLQKDRFQSVDEFIAAVNGEARSVTTDSEVTVVPVYMPDDDKTILSDDVFTVVGIDKDDDAETVYADDCSTVFEGADEPIVADKSGSTTCELPAESISTDDQVVKPLDLIGDSIVIDELISPNKISLKRQRVDIYRPIRIVKDIEFNSGLDNIPVAIAEGYIVSDRETCELFASIIFKNVSNLPISSLSIRLYLYLNQNIPYKTVDFEYSQKDLTFGIIKRKNRELKLRESNKKQRIEIGESFGDCVFVPIPETYFSKLEVALLSVVYSNGVTEEINKIVGRQS